MTPTGIVEDQWDTVQTWIRNSGLSNFHRHISGSLSPEYLLKQYRENTPACQVFQKQYGLDPTQPGHIREVVAASLARVEEGWQFFEAAFNPGRFLLNNDPEFRFHRRCFQQVVVDSLEQSTRLVGIRATLGCHWRTASEFKALLGVAVQGILEGESLAGGQGKGVLILSLRKDSSPEAASNALRTFLDVREEWAATEPSFAEKLYGLDSIGPEGSFDPAVNVPLFSEADARGLSIFHHLGEIWEDGELVQKLEQIQGLLAKLNISYLTNPVALMVDYESLPEQIYPKGSVQNLTRLRQQIFSEMKDKGIALEISPTSNEMLTRRKRRYEGWQFIPLRDIMREGVRISVTDDDGCIFETSLLGEYHKLYLGTTPYGAMNLNEIKELIMKGQNANRKSEGNIHE